VDPRERRRDGVAGPPAGFRPKPSPDHSGVRLVANCSRSCCCAVNMRRPLRKRLHDAAASGRRIWAEAGRRACGGGGTRQTAVRVCDRGLAVPAGWTRLAQPQQFTGKLFTSFRGRKIPRLRGRRRSFGPSRSFHGLVAKASSAKKVAPARKPSPPGSARFSDGALTYTAVSGHGQEAKMRKSLTIRRVIGVVGIATLVVAGGLAYADITPPPPPFTGCDFLTGGGFIFPSDSKG